MVRKGALAHKVVVSGWALAVLLAATAAHAESGTTRFATFLHMGPGRQYAVTDEVPTHTTVEVAGCQQNWCQIRYGGVDGWIDQHMLAAALPPVGPASECFDYAQTGWPHAGDLDRVCIHPDTAGQPAPR